MHPPSRAWIPLPFREIVREAVRARDGGREVGSRKAAEWWGGAGVGETKDGVGER